VKRESSDRTPLGGTSKIQRDKVGPLKGAFLSEQGDSGKDNQFTDPDVKLGSPEPRAAVLARASAAKHRPTCLYEIVCNGA
jgi:hypothetical protein